MNERIFLEHKEVYKGLPLYVYLIDTGYRGGYIGVTELDDYNEKYDYDYEVHGGVTWNSTREKFENCYEIKVHPAIKYILGFDTGHCYDKPDTKLTYDIFGAEPSLILPGDDGVVRSTEYCINECKSLIDQIVKNKN